MLKHRKLNAGDWVQVRSREEILLTLDHEGQLGGIPFMPEMFGFCGKRVKVFKRAHKTCDTVFPVRSRRVPNAVHLETRCDGSAHGGCQAACLLFWREEWLIPIQGPEASAPPSNHNPALAAKDRDGGCKESDVWARVEVSDRDGGPPTYVCQSTRLPYFSSDLEWWNFSQYMEDYSSGNVSIWRMFCGAVFMLYYKISQAGIGLGKPMRWFYDRFYKLWGDTPYPRKNGVIAAGNPTPTVSLNLQPGDLVRVKSQDEILRTVDTLNRNRGMRWDAEMVPFCGKVYRVLNKVTRLVNEQTGKMQEMKNPCIVLDSVLCEGRYSPCRMFCPRAIYPYWREVWLEKVDSGSGADKPS